MKTLKTLVSFIVIIGASVVYGQTSQANFSSQNDIWKPSGNQHISEFKVEADAYGLSQIQELYSGLGDDVQFILKNSTANTHTIELKFSSAVHKVYLYKMLVYIGCNSVKIGSQTLTIDEFSTFFV